MYVSKKDLDFIYAVLDQINNVIEGDPSDIDYWQNLHEEGDLLKNKMAYQVARQKHKARKKKS